MVRAIFLQSENVFELGCITNIFYLAFWRGQSPKLYHSLATVQKKKIKFKKWKIVELKQHSVKFVLSFTVALSLPSSRSLLFNC